MTAPREVVELVHRLVLDRDGAIVGFRDYFGPRTAEALAAASARPPVFLAATAAGVGLATRRVPAGRRRRARVAGFAGAALVGVAVFVATALLPLGDPGCRRPS